MAIYEQFLVINHLIHSGIGSHITILVLFPLCSMTDRNTDSPPSQMTITFPSSPNNFSFSGVQLLSFPRFAPPSSTSNPVIRIFTDPPPVDHLLVGHSFIIPYQDMSTGCVHADHFSIPETSFSSLEDLRGSESSTAAGHSRAMSLVDVNVGNSELILSDASGDKRVVHRQVTIDSTVLAESLGMRESELTTFVAPTEGLVWDEPSGRLCVRMGGSHQRYKITVLEF